MKILLPALLLLAELPAAYAGGRARDAGTAAGQFLKLGADARAMAMGSAVSAFAEDSSAVYWNPAGLSGLTYRHVSFTHAALHQQVFADFISYAQPVASLLAGRRARELRTNQMGSVGAAVLYHNSGNIPELDNTGTTTGGNFTPRDYAVMAGWGGALNEHLDAGLGIKYINSRITEEASTGAVDAGVRLRFRVWRFPVRLALLGQHIGGALKHNRLSDPLPLTLKAGLSVKLLRNWTLMGEAVSPRDNEAYASIGSELRLAVTARDGVALRVGFNGRNKPAQVAGVTGVTAGAGIRISWFHVDYAWQPFGALDEEHRFTASARF